MLTSKRLFQTACLLSVASVCLTSSATAHMKMSEALMETLKSNPEILADRHAAKSNEHAIRRAQAGYLPTVDLEATAGYEHSYSKFSTTPCAVGFNCKIDRFRTNPTVNVTQNIFDGLRTPRNVARARSEHFQAEKQLEETSELVAFRTINAFIDVRRFQRLLRLAQQNAKAHRDILAKVNKLIDGGRASVADRHTVTSRLSDAEAAVVDIKGDLDSAVARFRALVGVMPHGLGSAAVPDSYMPKTLDEAISVAHQRNRSVLLAQSSVKVAEAELASAQTSFLPSLSVEGSATHAKNNTGRKGFGNTVTVLGALRYNLYNGGADSARVSQVTETVAQQNHRLELARRTAEEEVRRSWAERESARGQSVQLRRSVSAKARVQDAFLKQYDLGNRTLLDVLDSRNEFFLAKGSLITVDATQDLTEARLLASMGVLLEKFGITDPMSHMGHDDQMTFTSASTASDTTHQAQPKNNFYNFSGEQISTPEDVSYAEQARAVVESEKAWKHTPHDGDSYHFTGTNTHSFDADQTKTDEDQESHDGQSWWSSFFGSDDENEATQTQQNNQESHSTSDYTSDTTAYQDDQSSGSLWDSFASSFTTESDDSYEALLANNPTDYKPQPAAKAPTSSGPQFYDYDAAGSKAKSGGAYSPEKKPVKAESKVATQEQSDSSFFDFSSWSGSDSAVDPLSVMGQPTESSWKNQDVYSQSPAEDKFYDFSKGNAG